MYNVSYLKFLRKLPRTNVVSFGLQRLIIATVEVSGGLVHLYLGSVNYLRKSIHTSIFEICVFLSIIG